MRNIPYLNTLFRLYSGVLGYIYVIMKHMRQIFLACILVGVSLPAVSVHAREVRTGQENLAYALPSHVDLGAKIQRTDTPVQYAQQRAARSMSASQAKSIAMRRYPGARFINVQLRGNRYIVRLQLKNGKIVDVSVDASPR